MMPHMNNANTNKATETETTRAFFQMPLGSPAVLRRVSAGLVVEIEEDALETADIRDLEWAREMTTDIRAYGFDLDQACRFLRREYHVDT